MINISGLHKSYGDVHVLKGLDLEVEKGEFVAIAGASGAGKTTLLQMIGTLDAPDKGILKVDNTAVQSLKGKELSKFRNEHIGFVFQFHQLLPEFTALENICIPAFIKGVSRSNAEKEAFQLLEILNLSHRAQHKPNELSGGEQQRVAVARALINKPSVILADEPSGNLDSKNAEELHKLFLDLNQKYGYTFVIVTHNKELAAMAHRTLTMKDGVIID